MNGYTFRGSGALDAQWVKHWPADLALGAQMFPIVNKVLLHTVFLIFLISSEKLSCVTNVLDIILMSCDSLHV